MRLRLAACALAALSLPSLARADTPPTVWDLGKNPNAFAQRRQHLALEEKIETAEILLGDPQIVGQLQAAKAEGDARELAEGWRGPKDSWLRYDDAWIAMKRQQWAVAVPILEGLARELGNSYFSEEVWQKLAECYVRLERTHDEIHAYDEVLARATTDGARLTPMLNQGEAYMRSGDADAAVARFRELVPLAARVNAVDISLLAQWDLAVALDRSGDFRTALETARAALRMDGRCVARTPDDRIFVATDCTKVPKLVRIVVPAGLYVVSQYNASVYFVPEYERQWYMALGRAAVALDAASARDKADEWRAAEASLTSYVNGATLHGTDHWLEVARRRLDLVRKRRLEADAHAPPPAPEELSF